LGKDVANLAGKPIELFNGDKKENEYKSFNSKLKQIPLVKGFVASDYASKTLDKFYEDKTKANTQYTDAKFKSSEKKMTYAEQKEVQYYKDLNSIYTTAYNDIRDIDEQIDKVTNGTGTDKYKELRIEQLRKQKDKIAETAEEDSKKLKAKNKLITEAERKNKLFGK
jgi:small-conductance mechanosensitive channel